MQGEGAEPVMLAPAGDFLRASVAREEGRHPWRGVSYDRVIGIDWSGAEKPANQQIFVAEVSPDEQPRVQSVVRAADRAAVERFLAGASLKPARPWDDWPRPAPPACGERVLVGLDFAFGFPADFALPGNTDWRWEELAAWATGLESQKLDDAIRADPVLRREFFLDAGDAGQRLLRQSERALEAEHGVRPSSVLHLVGALQVGRGALRGIPMLARLRRRHQVAVWPFDDVATARLTVIEVFPRLFLEGGLQKEHLPERVKQLQAWRAGGIAFQGEAKLAALASADALDATAAAVGLAALGELKQRQELPVIASREGWVAGA